MVARINFGEHSALFAGDLHNLGEMLCITVNGAQKMEADLMKVPHHGQDTSSSSAFLGAVKPELAVATGRVEITEPIKKNYTDANITLLQDLTHGYIHISADSAGEMTYDTSRNPAPGEITAGNG